MKFDPPISIKLIKEEFENYFDSRNISSVFSFEIDPTTNGYCYLVFTDYGSGIFSDNNVEKKLKMFILQNSVINYANSENLTDDQFSNMKSCIEMATKQDFLFTLSNPFLQPKLTN